MNRFVITIIAFGVAILGANIADAVQDACFDLTNCGDEFGFYDESETTDYIEYLRENYGIGIDADGICFDDSCNMPRAECRQYCHELHDRLMQGCSGLMTARSRAICRAQAMEEYGRCLARCR